MTSGYEALDRLTPDLPWQADWSDVLARAGERRPGMRRFVIALAVLAAVAIPLAALAAANDWWFMRFGNAPRPLHGPVVVKEGTWSGRAWQLIAYPAGTDGLCVSVTPKGASANGAGAAMGCGPFVGVSRTADTKKSPDMTITYLAGSGGLLPPYIVGPVIETATEVEISYVNGHILRVPTFVGPAPLEHVRFYATELSESVAPIGPGAPLKWLAGLDERGNVVACLAPATAKDGISPLTDCR